MKIGILASAVAACVASTSFAQSITTAVPNNGSGGIFLELTPTAAPIEINSFQTYFTSAAGTPVTVEVWTRPGTYAGFTASNVGWTLHQTVVGTSAGSAVLSTPVVINPLQIALGGPTAVYLHAITAGGGIRYTGVGANPPTHQVLWSNPDVSLFSDVSRTGALPFAGTQFTPRTFAGTINYTVVPAPASLALLGLGGLVAARRRR